MVAITSKNAKLITKNVYDHCFIFFNSSKIYFKLRRAFNFQLMSKRINQSRKNQFDPRDMSIKIDNSIFLYTKKLKCRQSFERNGLNKYRKIKNTYIR